MQENLIGYLLGALDDAEMARVESQLQRDPYLRARLNEAARSLRLLKQDRHDDIEPPSGLVASTCGSVWRSMAARMAAGQERAADAENWSIADIAVACAVVLAACLLFFPAVNNSRYHAQIAGCQNNLRSIGRALIEYSGAHPQGLFPQIPESGNLAVAGMYAPTLVSFGFVTDDHQFFCPSSVDLDPNLVCDIPSLEEIEKAEGKTVHVMQRGMGGHYGFTLGTQEGGQLRGIRNRSRNHFAIMSDTPATLPCQVDQLQRRRHRNVLFESGGLRLLSSRTDCWCGDQLYINDDGVVSAGVHDSDAVIGASHTPPILFTTR